MTRMPEHERLKAKAKGRECLRCGSEGRIAWLNGAYVHRCNCWPELPKLVPKRNAGAERLGKMVSQDLETKGLTDEKGLVPFDTVGGKVMTIAEFNNRRELLKHVIGLMQEGYHYGNIPGTKGRSLWEPGAEYLRGSLRLPWDFTVERVTEDWDKAIFRTRVKAFIPFGEKVGAAWIATATSTEEKFKGTESGKLADLVEDTAIKRAFVRLMRNVSGTSGDFAGAEEGNPNKGPVETLAVKQSFGADDAPMGVCANHSLAFERRQGTKNGKAYDFWACPWRSGKKGLYCDQRPEDWLKAEMTNLGLGSNESLTALIAPESWPSFKEGKTYAEIMATLKALVKSTENAESVPQPASAPESGMAAPTEAPAGKPKDRWDETPGDRPRQRPQH